MVIMVTMVTMEPYVVSYPAAGFYPLVDVVREWFSGHVAS